MKIGILTFWWSQDNYGQLLQCYALQKYLRDLGHDAFLIRYKYQKDIVPSSICHKILKCFDVKKLSKFLKYKFTKKTLENERKSNPRFFDDFRNKYIKQSEQIFESLSELQNNPPEADCYVVGSDQVWNNNGLSLKRFKKILHSYFLDFGKEKTKRISYAASWGIISLSDTFINEIKPLLVKFDAVSVREKSGVELCAKCGADNAEWVCDPTFLLCAEDYRKLYKENDFSKQTEKYLFLYLLGNEYKFDISKVFDFASSNGLKVVYVTGNNVVDSYLKTFATIPEWLYLIDNAEFIITNSFHCGIFSSIFSKKFGIVPLIGKDKGMNSRFESLFEMLGIEERFIYASDFSALDKNYQITRIDLIQSSKKFLDSALSEKTK